MAARCFLTLAVIKRLLVGYCFSCATLPLSIELGSLLCVQFNALSVQSEPVMSRLFICYSRLTPSCLQRGYWLGGNSMALARDVV